MAARTIVAVASPPGPGRRGIVRLSGPRSAELVRATVRGESPRFEPALPRLLARGRFDDGGGEQPVTLLWMRGPRSFTREDVAELHLPGNEPLLAAALARLLALGADAARPGEFTRRAFENGRIDLSRAEGVLALTEAASEAERAAAALLLDGGLDARAAAIRERVSDLSALCEAALDFDELETGAVPGAELSALARAAGAAVDEALAWELARAAPSALPRVVLVGAPNAGKSSLWNALTGGRALVAPLAGTTRDALEAPWRAGALECLLVDGPGLERAAAGAAARAQELFARARGHAELALWVADATAPIDAASIITPPEGARVLAWTKCDLESAAPPPAGVGIPAVAVSARSGEGLAELGRAVERALGASSGPAGEGGAARLLLARHREALARARAALAECEAGLAERAPLDLAAEAARGALAALDELSGRTTSEDVLDRIFARFCLGK